MKERKNIRDTFKINNKVDDMYKDQFIITNLEGGSSFSVDYQYYDGGLVNKTLNSNGITPEYVGVLKPSIMYVEAVSVSGFGYSYDLSTLNAAYPASHLGELTPNNNISLFNMGGGILANIPVIKDVILNVDDSEYYLKYGVNLFPGFNLTHSFNPYFENITVETFRDLEKYYNISYSYSDFDIVTGSTVGYNNIFIANSVNDDNVKYYITSEETAKNALDLIRDGFDTYDNIYNTNGGTTPEIGDNILTFGVFRTYWGLIDATKPIGQAKIIHVVDGYVVDVINY
jgi:hypothetical protein